MRENPINPTYYKIKVRARAGSLIKPLSSPVGFGMDAKLKLREEKDMKTKDTVKKVMAIWRQFLTDNGGRENLNANILWRWPRYLKKEGREGRC